MIIIAGHELVDAEDRDAVVAAFGDLVRRARAFDGCLHIALTADQVDAERINLVEIWRDADTWDRWRRVARGPKVGAPRQVEIRRYDAFDGGSLS